MKIELKEKEVETLKFASKQFSKMEGYKFTPEMALRKILEKAREEMEQMMYDQE